MNMNEIGEQTREFYRRQGELRERERIIELLESKSDSPCCCFTGSFGEHDLPDLIALIKGENK